MVTRGDAVIYFLHSVVITSRTPPVLALPVGAAPRDGVNVRVVEIIDTHKVSVVLTRKSNQIKGALCSHLGTHTGGILGGVHPTINNHCGVNAFRRN